MKKFAVLAVTIGVLGLSGLYLFATTTTNMGMDLPVVGQTTGPDWATKLNAAFQVVDAHTHAPGSGVQILNSGISSSAAIDRSKMAATGGSLVLINDTTGVMSGEAALSARRGGTGFNGFSLGDILYACSPTSWCKLTAGSASQLLRISSGLIPEWATVSPGSRPTVQKFTSGTGTYTRPTSPTPIYIQVEIVGAGGGGGAGATNNGAAGSAATTFGSELSAGAGGGGEAAGSAGGVGGTASLTGSNFSGIAVNGSAGQGAFNNAVANILGQGGQGGASAFGGEGAGGQGGAAGVAAATNSGSGGGGAGGNSGASGGAGGGSGAYLKVVSITAPSTTYAYAIGAGGAGGAAGNDAGGNGAAGQIIVTEFY